MVNKKVQGLLLTGIAVLSVAAVAQDESGAPVGIKLAPGVRGIAQLDSEVAYTTNFFYRPDSDDQVSATGVVFRPALAVDGDKGAFSYNLGLGGELAKWDVEGDLDDYEDSVLRASFNWAAATRHSLRGRVVRLDDHDPFGTLRTEVLAADRDLDKWHQNETGLTYRFGAAGAKINLEAAFTNRDREYDTNREFTRFLDYSTDVIRATAFYNLSAKTALVAEVLDTEHSYDENVVGFRRDSEERSYRVGASWRATGKTVGDVRIGRVEHDFDDPAGGDFEETDWQAGVTWSPRVRTALALSSGRESQESYRPDTRFINNEFLTLSWTESWSSRFKTTLQLGRLKALFVDSRIDVDPTPAVRLVEREDELDSLSLTGEYQLAPSIHLRGGWSRGQRDSNVGISQYDADITFVGLRVLF